MIKSLSFFEFTSGGYFATSYTVKYENGVLRTRVEEGGMPPMQLTDVEEKDIMQPIASDAFAVAAIKALNKANFLSWEPDYSQPICDGIQWELNVRYNGNLKKKVTGSNEYPLGFEFLDDLFAELFPENKEDA